MAENVVHTTQIKILGDVERQSSKSVRFSISGIPIPTLSEKPMKSLRKIFDSNLKDTASNKNYCKELEVWLKEVNKSGFPRKFKAWIYQLRIIPRFLWPLADLHHFRSGEEN